MPGIKKTSYSFLFIIILQGPAKDYSLILRMKAGSLGLEVAIYLKKPPQNHSLD